MDLRLNRKAARLSFRISRYGVTAISSEIAWTSLGITFRHDLTAGGLPRYEPVLGPLLAEWRGKLCPYPTRNFATLGPFIRVTTSLTARDGWRISGQLSWSPMRSDYLILVLNSPPGSAYSL